MIFGPVALDEAEGCILAHTQRLPGLAIKKGSRLDAAAITALRTAGRDPVIAARLEPGDVPEDQAASRLADALITPGLDRSRAGTGRVNLVASRAGLLRVDAAAVDALNRADEGLTLATLPDWSSVAAGEMLATIKIIPFAVPGAPLEAAVQAAAAAPMRLHPYHPRRVGLVMTRLPGLKASVLAGTAEATGNRVAGLGGTMLPPVECPHAADEIADALTRLIADGAEILLVAGASAVVDRRDVGPSGIVAAGGEILHFGMPVDPGNLICLGRIGDRPALVLPGCARSPALNGIDWVLSRLFAGLTVDAAAMAGMGVGGLLKDVGARPLPRAKAAAPRPAIATVVLAAGRSSRMAPDHKLLIPDRNGKPMLARVVDNLLAAAPRPVIVVLGHRAAEIEAALGARPVQQVQAPDWQSGLAASLRAGISAVPDSARAAIVCLGDMPLVTARVIGRLIEAYDPDEGRLIIAPSHGGQLGNPILWDRRFFAEIMALSGDRGARGLLDRYAEYLVTIPLDDDAVLRDVDTREQLAALPAHLQPASRETA
ncbi:MAG: NTP transferase domain-containing protein [Janthinobacterium lividum]